MLTATYTTNVNTEQLKALFNYCERLGIKTVGQLAEFKAKAGCSTNAELLKALKEASE